MKNNFLFVGLLCISFACVAQIDTINREIESMSATYQKAYRLGSVYYKTGTNTPFTGILYGKYNNGNYQTMQEYVNGVGNGKWVDFNPEGIKECEGTYKDNRVEGPVTFFYEDGSIKSEGQYLHWKKPIGLWKYYNKKGNLVHTMTYTR
jgi:antitoxin component YwqK of YwqJK toxin-antitoxin module